MPHKRWMLLLCALLLLCAPALSAEKNPDNLPIGNLAGYEGGSSWFGEGFAYDITDEAACWELLMRPITVLNTESEKDTVYPLDAPNGERVVDEWQGGFINGDLAGCMCWARTRTAGPSLKGWIATTASSAAMCARGC